MAAAQLLAAAEAPPPVEWQASFGGSGSDSCRHIVPTGDGGYVLGGRSTSGRSGNKTSAQYGGNDLWLVKMDRAGNKVWDRSFGGSGDEGFYYSALAATPDGGFLLGGDSWSGVSGNKTSPRQGGDADAWLVKVDASGNKLWDRSYGGTSEYDTLFTIVPLADGGAFLGGISNSRASGNKSSAHLGGFDFWLIRVDAVGNKLWDKSFGGSGDEGDLGGDLLPAVSIVPSGDGGCLMGGPSNSGVSGNKTSPNQGDFDYWLLRIDADGNKLWDRSYGGNRSDFLTSMIRTPDGGLLLGGKSESDVSGNKTSTSGGLGDFWVVKVDAAGNMEWDKSFGGTADETLYSIAADGSGGFLLGGQFACFSCSDLDFWLVKVDATGSFLWEQSFGGPYTPPNGVDVLRSVLSAEDGGLLLAGASSSGIRGNKTSPNYGGSDFWAIKLGAPARLSMVHGNGLARISWPRTAASYLLEGAPALAPGPAATPWSKVPPPYETNDTHISVSVPMSDESRFFRLRSP